MIALYYAAAAPFAAIAVVVGGLLAIAVRGNHQEGRTWDGHNTRRPR